jgi:hypothetical protein
MLKCLQNEDFMAKFAGARIRRYYLPIKKEKT